MMPLISLLHTAGLASQHTFYCSFKYINPFESVANVDFCGRHHVLFPTSIRICGKGESGLEISSCEWICGMESCPCELCVGHSE